MTPPVVRAISWWHLLWEVFRTLGRRVAGPNYKGQMFFSAYSDKSFKLGTRFIQHALRRYILGDLQPRHINHMTIEAFHAEYKMWADSAAVPPEQIASSRTFRCCYEGWKHLLVMRKISQHSRCPNYMMRVFPFLPKGNDLLDLIIYEP